MALFFTYPICLLCTLKGMFRCFSSSFFKGVEIAHVNEKRYSALGMPGFSHFYRRAFKVLLHFEGNLSEETEGLILQTANILIVLNKTFHGLFQSPMNSRKTVDFTD